MVTLDPSTFVLVVLAAALVGALIAVMPVWQGLRGGRELPVWGYLQRRNVWIGRASALQAELRCDTCNAKVRCAQMLAEGADTPVPDCPNERLFPRA